jgi:NAD+ synthase
MTDPETAPLPQIEPAQAVDVIVGFIRAQMAQTGFERIVLGLSGGVDSATVAFLCARAIGPDSLLAVRMPYRSSSEASEADALRVVDALGCRAERVEITPMVDPMLALVEADGDAANVRHGNVMARQRMIVLYDRSAAFDALVAGTSNKTEALLGYGTLHGDMAAAFAPIGDLYKTQLRAVARELGVPEEVVAKPPSADLWPGQTDESEGGFSYPMLDRLLFWRIDKRRSIEEMEALGFDRATVERVDRMVAASEFKRQVPPIAKLGPRTSGIDYLYPRRRPGSARG